VEEARSVCGTTFSTTRTPLAYSKKLICRQNSAERNPSIIGATENLRSICNVRHPSMHASHSKIVEPVKLIHSGL
jgi:hypothetical protein